MDRREIRERSREAYANELQYALACDDEVDTDAARERATIRLAREGDPEELIYELWRGMVESIAKTVERHFVVDLTTSQLVFGGAIRTNDNTLCPIEKARVRDWLAFDEIRERVFQEHAAKRASEREAIRLIVERLGAHGGDPTTFEACPDLFLESGEATG